MKIYLSGPMTDLPDLNYPAFMAAEARLMAKGYDVLNPACNVPPVDEPGWADFMRMSLVQIAEADGIAKLPGWAGSKGAAMEVRVAQDLGLDVRLLEEW